MQNSPAVQRIRAAFLGTAAILLIVVWNLWLRLDPMFFMRLLNSTADLPGPYPVVPWFVPVFIAGFVVFFVAVSFFAQRRAERVAGALASRAG